MKKKISIIIPVYNYEKYLRKCLDSIIEQTYKNLEIIVIDDGSTDSCPEIIDEYALKDTRIIAHHQKNAGIGNAWMRALSIATGDYVAFVDSDDWMEKNAYEELQGCAGETNADIIAFGATYYDLNDKVVDKVVDHEQTIVGRDNILSDYLYRDKNTVFSRKICKRELFDGVTIPEQSVGADESLSIQVYNKAQKLVKLEKCYYNVLGCEEKDSVGRRSIDGKYLEQQLITQRFIVEYLKVEAEDFALDYMVFYLRFLRGKLLELTEQNNEFSALRIEYADLFQECKNNKLYSKTPILIRISLSVFRYFPNLYKKIYEMR